VVNRAGSSFAVFERARAPRGSTSPAITWVTWSKQLWRFVETFEPQLRKISRPALVDVPGCEPYQSTYDVPFDRLDWLPARDVRWLADALSATMPGTTLMVLDRAIANPIDSDLLLALFVVFRACLVHTSGVPARAMCRPVPSVSRDAGFPLHADLYLHRRLLVVFDDVARSGGASTFLSVNVLGRLLRDAGCPAAVRGRIRSLLSRREPADRFDELFDLLHDGTHPWVSELEHQMTSHQLVVPLRRGQGYLIDDRKWLHGRLPSIIPVRAGRFRRLAF